MRKTNAFTSTLKASYFGSTLKVVGQENDHMTIAVNIFANLNTHYRLN